jgi:hypothetical protein
VGQFQGPRPGGTGAVDVLKGKDAFQCIILYP